MAENGIESPVLIVGAGPVGCCLALELAFLGQRSIIVEQDAGTGTELLAKAGTLNERTMEFCRRWGLVDEIADVGFPDDYPRDTYYCTSLNGHVIGKSPMPSTLERKPYPFSPEILRKCGQHIFDPLAARAALATGLCEIRYGTRFESLVQDDAGVTAEVTDLTSGDRRQIRANYLVACDGSTSVVRTSLGIAMPGRPLDYSVSAMLRIPELEKYHPLGRAERFMFIGTSGTWANMTAVDGIDLWRFTLVGSEEKLDLETLDVDQEIRRAFGNDDVPYEILRVMPWRRAQTHAVRYREGRVLLAGDACHTTSPTGGHGLNTGVGDIASLGWMLDAMLRGWGGVYLLDAYGAERRPVALRNLGNSTENYEFWLKSEGYEDVFESGESGDAIRKRIGEELQLALRQEWHSTGIGLGYSFHASPIVCPDGSKAPLDDPSEYIQTSRPGHRAPHAWLPDGRSILDLFGRGFVLLRLGSHAPPVDAFLAPAAEVGMPLEVIDLPQPEIEELYERRLVLVRPDGMVAWRDDFVPSCPEEILDIVRGAPLRR
jgi:2-polyprenyl-6-methoxyphenol hydroxylase-like FAD-dependent oxidoreductase